ncbi:atp synthase i [Jiella sp. 40Bstr34]|uniref:Atp synthase i n=2 Tax=Jiella pacifica TaxID=2696469 RepID=A0A6N9T6J7_9HYPH|nr:atp synthase i [Jiella pacifica]
MQGLAEGLKLGSEFVAGVVVGAAIGYGIDSIAGTMPFGLIVFLMIGFGAGVRNVLRSVSPKREPSANAAEPPSKDFGS